MPDQAVSVILTRRRLLRRVGGALLLLAGLPVVGPAFPLAPRPARAADDPRLDTLWRCLGSECPGYVYDPRLGEIASDTPPLTVFEQLSDDWQCPRCGAGKLEFHARPRPA